MCTEALKRLFRPRGVVVLAPPASGAVVPPLARSLAEGGYQGRIVLWGEGPLPPPPFERCSAPAEAGPGLDLALVTGEVESLAAGLVGLGAAGVKSVVAYGESPPGEAWRESLSAAARAAGVRLVGPGSWGVINTAVGLAATLERPSLRHGGLALVTQSGAVCSCCLAEGAGRDLGWGLVLDLGAEVDLSQNEVIDYLAAHYQAKALILHVDRVRRPGAFMSAALAAARRKPVVAIKTGESARPRSAPPSHAFPEPTHKEAWGAALSRAGVLCVDNLDELLAVGELVERWPSCRGPRLAVITASVGAGRLALDANRRHGLAPAELGEETRLVLAALGCLAAEETGLVLLGPDVDEAAFQAVAAACLQAPGVDAVLAVLAPCRCLEPAKLALALRRAAAQCQAGPRRVLTLAVWPGGLGSLPDGPHGGPVAMFATLEGAVDAFAGLWRYTELMQIVKEVPRPPLGRFQFDQPAASRLLEEALGQGRSALYAAERRELFNAYRLPVLPIRAVKSPEELREACEAWGYPARLLLTPRPISGGESRPELAARLDNAAQVPERWQLLHQSAARQGLAVPVALVQPWPSTAKPKLMMGWRRHPELGPLLVFGEGGERPEALRERAWGLPPLNRALAQALMSRTQIYDLVTGGERQDRVWPSMLEEVLIKLAQMAQDLPQITNMIINPVLLADNMAWCADARIELAPVSRPALSHLIVSPYPAHHETRACCREGLEVLLRPIRPEDAHLVQEFFSQLSPDSTYSRFFQDLPALSAQMLMRLTQIDYGREIALGAVLSHGMTEKLLGLCSLAQRPGSDWAEFAVVVADPWQRRGIGKLLLSHMLNLARSRGQLKIMGVVLRHNRAMSELGRSLGFRAGKPQNGLVELRLELEGDV